jgi:hypothetical protein
MKLFNILVLILALPCAGFSTGAVIPESVKQAFKNGNSQELVKYFNSAVELDIVGKEDVYAKDKAEQLLNTFFAQHPINGFTVLYEGGKDANQFAIGKLISSKGIFRVTILMKGVVILQLRIEVEDGN